MHLIHRRKHFKAEKILIDRLLNIVKARKVVLHLDSTVQEILGNHEGVTDVLIQNTNLKEKKRKKIIVSGIFIAIGYIPNTDIFTKQLKTKDGYITVKKGIHGNYTQTSISGIFAAGDVIDHVYRQAITSSASGCMAALDSERYLNSLN